MALSRDPEKRKRQLANLRPFGPGPDGRRGDPHHGRGTVDLKRRLKQALLEAAPGDLEGRQYAELFVRNELARALKGEKDARQNIWRLFEEDMRSGDGSIAKVIIEHVFTGKPYPDSSPTRRSAEGEE